MLLDTKTELAELLFHSLGTATLSCTFPCHLDWEYPFEVRLLITRIYSVVVHIADQIRCIQAGLP